MRSSGALAQHHRGQCGDPGTPLRSRRSAHCGDRPDPVADDAGDGHLGEHAQDDRSLGEVYCIDILTQISSVTAALEKVALGLVDQHLRYCVLEAMAVEPEFGEERLAEATRAVERLLRL